MARSIWKERDPLFRGDDAGGPALPDPEASLNLVAHILYLGGPGRRTPYSSTTESEEVAEHFARPGGAVFETSSARARSTGAGHIPRKRLLQDLRAYGKGLAKWTDAWEVAQARNYVEQWSEHLLDWRSVSPADIRKAISTAFRRRG
jgi:hypothetical protein